MNYPLKEGIISYMFSGNAAALLHTVRVLINHYPKQTMDCLMNILGTHDTSRILTVLGGIHCNNKNEMASDKAYLTPENKQKAIKKLKMAVVLQYTLPGVPCVYYGDENASEGHIDPFCRKCFDWEHLNTDLIAFYQKLGEIRKDYQYIFKDGEFKEIIVEDGLLAFKRFCGNNELYVYVNNSENRYVIQFPNTCRELLNDVVCENQYEIKPNSYAIFIKK